jgi:hypothetical protein
VGLGQPPGQPAHLLRIHPAVVIRVADVELAGRVHGGQVRAVGLVGGHAGAVEAGGCRHRLGKLSGQAQAEAPAHAVPDGADRAVADLDAIAQERQPEVGVGIGGLRRDGPDLGAEFVE